MVVLNVGSYDRTMTRESAESSAPMSTMLTMLLWGSVAAQLAAVGVAHADISRRDPSELNGSKTKWRAITLIHAIGPLWYFRSGRR